MSRMPPTWGEMSVSTTLYPVSASSMAALMPEIPAPTTRTVPIRCSSAMRALLFDLTGDVGEFVVEKHGQGQWFFQGAAGLIVEPFLDFFARRSEDGHQVDPVGTTAGALAAADAGGADMGDAGHMIEDRVRGHGQIAQGLGPIHELIARVPEGVGDEHAFLAIADRAGHPAVV